MTEYKYISVVIDRFDQPFEIKLATQSSNRIDRPVIDQTVEMVSEKIKEYDNLFSLENKESLLNKFQDGDETVLLVSKTFQDVYEQTIMAEQMTQHYFSSYYNSKYDPIGLLNGWMIDHLFNRYLVKLLSIDGIDGVSLRCGEDVRLASRPNIDFRWRVAIKNPEKANALLATYFLQNGAVSTSNVMRSLRKEKSNIEQVTIIGNSALDTNIWSSAGISAGTDKFPEFIQKYHLTGMIVDKYAGIENFRDGLSDKIKISK